jgi:hypothetical protein
VLKIILTHIPTLAEFERWQIPLAGQPLDLLSATLENVRKVANVEHLA